MDNKVYYPAFLDLEGKRCVIVGGGRVAERKCRSLLDAGALVTIVSPDITLRIKKYKDKGLVRHMGREYRKGDLKSAFLVVSAAASREINEKVAQDAMKLHKLINVVDSPDLCNFIVPSVVRRGMLSIAISTGGAGPALSKAIRKDLQKLYGPEYAKKIKVIGEMREKAKKEIRSRKEREQFIKKATLAIKNKLKQGY